MNHENLNRVLEIACKEDNILIIQDLDGVCIPLVKDPLTRKIDYKYVIAAKKLEGNFYVLTNGEHEGRRGVNRLIEGLYQDKSKPRNDGLYLPGLAAGGVQYQNTFGETVCEGVNKHEIEFLSNLPEILTHELIKRLPRTIDLFSIETIEEVSRKAVLDTQLSPTINLNGIFNLIPSDIDKQRKVQSMLKELMDDMLISSVKKGLDGSFYLHIAPNLGDKNGRDIIKFSEKDDIGTTDIQFMLKGAIKEAGVLVLINNYIYNRTGSYPLGEDFNARRSPKSHKQQLELLSERIKEEEMPTIIGVGDTITSVYSKEDKKWLRGGSDRGFMQLIQNIGLRFKKNNQLILVDSSNGEVIRPSLSGGKLEGVSDKDDPLIFNAVVEKGPAGYISWFIDLANKRSHNCK